MLKYIGAGCSLIVLLFIFYKKWIFNYIEGGQFTKKIRADNKVIIITGANSGIGKATTIELAKTGAKIYMACRDYLRCEKARLEIIKISGNENIFFKELDLTSFDSIINFAREFSESEDRLDVLINNAGVLGCPRTLTTEGFEMHIGVNYVGHFLLVKCLMKLLKKSAPSRIVVVASYTHRWTSLQVDDLNSEKSYKRLNAYCHSKLANVMFTRSLSKRLEGSGVTINCLHPGVIKTEILKSMHPLMIYIQNPVQFLLKTPKSGAQTSVMLAIDPDLEKVSGKYFRDCKEEEASSEARNDEKCEWLWNKTEEWCNLVKKNKN